VAIVNAEYAVVARRSGSWWSISVPELPGVFSQAPTWPLVEPMAREAIALFLDVPEDSFVVSVREGLVEEPAQAAS
jgi:predicted RNase H-like HicB family nuclease